MFEKYAHLFLTQKRIQNRFQVPISVHTFNFGVYSILFCFVSHFTLHVSFSAAKNAASEFSFATAASVHTAWVKLFGTLFATYVDGCVLTKDPSEETCGCGKTTVGFSETEKQRIVAETGDHYLVPPEAAEAKKQQQLQGGGASSPKARSKLSLVDK